jgi:integrase
MTTPMGEQPWRWPFASETYNRSAALTEEERAFLTEEYRADRTGGCLELPALAKMQRLLQPLYDVFLYIEISPSKRKELVSLFLQEMQQRQTSFWSWTDQDWIDLANQHRYYANWLICVAFLLCDFRSLAAFPKRRQIFSRLAQRVFGIPHFRSITEAVQRGLAALGYRPRTLRLVPRTLAPLLLSIRSDRLEDLTSEVLLAWQRATSDRTQEKCLWAVSRFLASQGILLSPLPRRGPPRYLDEPGALLVNVPPEWARLARYWYDHSTLSPETKLRHYYRLLGIGRWLTATHPEVPGPEQWTRTTAAEAVAMLATQKSGEWSHLPSDRIRNFQQPYAPTTQMVGMTTLRTFFQDLQQWEVIPRRFDPYRAFRVPRSVRCLYEPDPRVLADDLWAKLVWAGLNLTVSDLPGQGGRGGGFHFYPLSFVRALAIVWLFGGLRWNEMRRLRLGCIRWQEDASGVRTCLLSVPVNKTGAAFTKPVDKLLGEAVETWEKERPRQSKMLDAKTGERVDYLFLFRDRRVGISYMNLVLIPALCRKAGLPLSDVRGRITCHRARATIASQLFNARDPMSLFELQAWLGHKEPSSTQHYVKMSPTKLMKSYAQAGYFERNLRAIEVLIDQEVIRQGLGGQEPWKFFDLGHGYCTYDFFDQCPHRMACAQCSFYVPKESSRAQMLEAKGNLLRLRQDIALGEAELAAVDEGLAAYEKLLASLIDLPTPAGETPRQLASQRLYQVEPARRGLAENQQDSQDGENRKSGQKQGSESPWLNST